MAYVQMAVALGLGGLSLAIFRLAYHLMRYDRVEYEKSRARYRSLWEAISGKATVRRSDLPDGRVRAGIVYNRKLNRIETNGKLRNDVIDHVI